ncbi:uncharacterized protein STEHIDRAFT_28021, partial [Stereum hirsutum FP-91666 SS1]|uniref:uncharacterized protein n=1 Tax=Stereum hirsutum (strain FP-91666) TaxID=721885 RepID=UPI000444A6F0
LRAGHDDVGHKGFYATRALLSERCWWPHMRQDIAWFVKTCHICQVRQMRQILIPPTVALPAPLFAKMHVDTMFLPASGGFKALVHGRFTDNGTPFLKAMPILEKKYHIKHIRILGYNSRANGIVERPHLDVRQALFKAVDGDESKWSRALAHVFWADRITVRRRMGCSPYCAVTGTEPILPLDITEASYLLPPPPGVLSTTELIVFRAIALQKRRAHLTALRSRVYSARVEAALCFEREHAHTIRDFDFQPGSLVLMRNTAIEKSLSRKMRPRYTGPRVVLARNRGGAYIVAELDGAVLHRPMASGNLV